MNHKRDLDLAVALFGPQFREHVRSIELQAEDPGERLAALVSLADRARSWCIVHRRVHEIRSPLNGLALTAQVLVGSFRGADPSAVDFVATMLLEVGRVATGLEDLVQAVQTEPARLVPVDLAELVRELVILVSTALDGAGIRLELVPSSSEVHVECNGAWTRHALLHVLMGAPPSANPVTLQVTASGKDGKLTVEHDAAFGPPHARRDRFAEIAQPLIRAQGGRLDRTASARGTRTELSLARCQPPS